MNATNWMASTVAILLLAAPAQATILVDDSFTGATLSSDWATFGNVTLDTANDQVLIQTAGGFARPYLSTTGTLMPSLAAPVMVSGTATTTSTGYFSFWLRAGAAVDPVNPDGSMWDSGIRIDVGGGGALNPLAKDPGAWPWSTDEFSNSSGALPSALAGQPFDFRIIDDGSSITFTLTNANNETGTASFDYLLNFTPSDHFAFGEIPSDGGTSMQNVRIESVPEPSSLVLLGMAMLFGLARVRRRR